MPFSRPSFQPRRGARMLRGKHQNQQTERVAVHNDVEKRWPRHIRLSKPVGLNYGHGQQGGRYERIRCSPPQGGSNTMNQPFIVVVTHPGENNDVVKRIEQQDHHQIADNVWLVRSDLLVKELTDADRSRRRTVRDRCCVPPKRLLLGPFGTRTHGTGWAVADNVRLPDDTSARRVQSRSRKALRDPLRRARHAENR